MPRDRWGRSTIRAAPLRLRIASWGWDYVAIVVWLGAVLAVIGLPQLLGWIDLEAVWSEPASADLGVAALTVIPYLVYLVVSEVAPARATWGKRRTGLVLYIPEDRSVVARVALRNAIKVLPWQLGHMSALRFAMPEVPTADALLLFLASILLLAAIVGPIPAGRRGLHDWAAGTDVRSA